MICKECKQDKEYFHYNPKICIDCHLELYSECKYCNKYILSKNVTLIDKGLYDSCAVCNNCLKEHPEDLKFKVVYNK